MGDFKPNLLSDSEKESLCRSLLEEFGVTRVKTNSRGELIHGCLISPYHTDQERNPTASLNWQKLTYHCFGCGSSGGLLWFIATVRKCSIQDAYAWIESNVRVIGRDVLDLDEFLRYLAEAFAGPTVSEPTPVYSARILEPWAFIHPWLTEGAPDLGIKGRGIPEKTLVEMQVGWNPDEDRIIIPHFWKDDLVGWQSRRLSKGGPKYISTPLFPRDSTLYAMDPRKRYERLVLVESPMSVLRHRHAVPDMVASFGGVVTDQQVALLARARQVVIWLDNDKGGWTAMEGTKNTPALGRRLSRHTNTFVVISPYDADPADLETDQVVDLIESAVPHVLWERPKTLMPVGGA